MRGTLKGAMAENRGVTHSLRCPHADAGRALCSGRLSLLTASRTTWNLTTRGNICTAAHGYSGNAIFHLTRVPVCVMTKSHHACELHRLHVSCIGCMSAWRVVASTQCACGNTLLCMHCMHHAP